ncbi:hypothetical protein D9758_003910 [Tetrapyrgos nigripes]|uniref:MFS general substrate transporter n=1 Tax=Tetrapyrgos nigripes TaxID=182062 RepID=A0A8H5GLD7_9AGAR|nr:hypothetical protein D9758_003910 [Tetrapyrgos nigripes]
MSWPWFGPIANDAASEMGWTLNQITWLGNIQAALYLPAALVIPHLYVWLGLRKLSYVGAILLIIASWVRYSGTVGTLTSNASFGLVFLGQAFASFAQPIYQVLGPKYSENWFDLKGRTTATMIVAMANPVGGAIGQLLSPLVGDTKTSILVLGIIGTAIAPFTFLIDTHPPTPPTFSASKKSPPFTHLLLDIVGKAPDSRMSSNRARTDFIIISLVFGTLVGATNTFSILTNQIMEPVGYDSGTSGLMGATLLLTGLVAAVITAPLFDRVLTHRLAFTSKLLVPILGAAWLSLIWAVTPNNTAALFVIMTIIGVSALTMLPIGLELGCDLTQNAEGSSSILWAMGNLMGFIFVLVENHLRAGPDAHPPNNMKQSLIFQGSFVMAIVLLIFFLEGKQTRKDLDEQHARSSGLNPEARRDVQSDDRMRGGEGTTDTVP